MKKISPGFIIGLASIFVTCQNDPAVCSRAVEQTIIDGVPKTQLNADIARLNTYFNANAILPIEDPSGLRYLITGQGTGAFISCLESTVTVNYSGKLLAANNTSLSPTTFDATGASPAAFPLNNLILGWQIGFLKLQKGSTATLYIPSGLGYGPSGYPPKIPANSVLVFQVEIVDFK